MTSWIPGVNLCVSPSLARFCWVESKACQVFLQMVQVATSWVLGPWGIQGRSFFRLGKVGFCRFWVVYMKTHWYEINMMNKSMTHVTWLNKIGHEWKKGMGKKSFLSVRLFPKSLWLAIPPDDLLCNDLHRCACTWEQMLQRIAIKTINHMWACARFAHLGPKRGSTFDRTIRSWLISFSWRFCSYMSFNIAGAYIYRLVRNCNLIQSYNRLYHKDHQ